MQLKVGDISCLLCHHLFISLVAATDQTKEENRVKKVCESSFILDFDKNSSKSMFSNCI